MKSGQNLKRQKLLWASLLLLAWGAVILLLLRHGGGFSARELAAWKSDRPLLSALVMLGLFLLKSVDFLMHSGVLYAASGILFPLPAALLLNTVGIAVMVTPLYFLGRAWGAPVIDALHRKFPKLREFDCSETGGSFSLAVLMRTAMLPVWAANLYMGAARFSFGRYLLGSILGLLPVMVPYTVMGESAGNVRSPAFLIAVACEGALFLLSLLVYALLQKKNAARRRVRGKV